MKQQTNGSPEKHPRLSLDHPATYQITVQGRLDSDWSDWFEGMTLTTAVDLKGSITTLTGQVIDQAALHGLLNKLYGLGLPLLALTCIDLNPKKGPGCDLPPLAHPKS
jgi:hypothetical protein